MTIGSEEPVFLSNGRELYDWDWAVEKMDDEVRGRVHNAVTLVYSEVPCSNQSFFDLYCIAHASKFKSDFELEIQD